MYVLKKLMCRLFGHKWVYIDYSVCKDPLNGLMAPEAICTRCGKAKFSW